MARLMKLSEILTVEELSAATRGAVTTSFPFDLYTPGGALSDGVYFLVDNGQVMRLGESSVCTAAC